MAGGAARAQRSRRSKKTRRRRSHFEYIAAETELARKLRYFLLPQRMTQPSRPARAMQRQLSLEIPSSESEGETGISFVDPRDDGGSGNINADGDHEFHDDEEEYELEQQEQEDEEDEDHGELFVRGGGGGGAQFQGEFDHYHADEQDADDQHSHAHSHSHSHTHSHGSSSASSGDSSSAPAPAPTPFHMVRVRHGAHERSMIVVRGIAVREVARLLRAALQTGAHTRVVALRDAQTAVVRACVQLLRASYLQCSSF